MDSYSSERRGSDGDFPHRERGRMPRNGRSGGGRPRERPRGGGRGGRSDYYSSGGGGGGGDGGGGGGGGGGRGLTILARERPPPGRMPGTVAIMQRATSGGQLSPSPVKSSSLNTSDPISPSPIYTHPSHPHPSHPHSAHPTHTSHLPHLLRASYDKNEHKGRPQRGRADGFGSGPSSFIPVHPAAGRGHRERGGDSLPSPASSSSSSSSRDAWNQANEMLHCVKLVDKNMHWEDKGTEYLLEQSDFLVVGVVGRQGVGKSTIMSILAGSRTGSGKPPVFRTESREVWEGESYQTTGIDMAITPERVILLDTQPVLSMALFTDNPSLVPMPMTGDTYLDLLSLQVALFLYTVCHVVVVVVDAMETNSSVFKFLELVEQMKPECVPKSSLDMDSSGEERHFDYFPQLVVVLNHASADDFQPFCLREHHCLLADAFHSSRSNLAGGVSLSRSGLVQSGLGFPVHSAHKLVPDVDPAAVNFHLLPTNTSASDSGTFCVTKPEKSEVGLNPLLSLLPLYPGHPSYQLLSETLRNQLFAMSRPPFRHMAQQQFTEKEWYDYSRRTWVTLKKTDLVRKYEQLMQTTPPGHTP